MQIRKEVSNSASIYGADKSMNFSDALKLGYKYAVRNKLFLSPVFQWMVGANVFPWGPAFLLNILGLILLFLNIVDVGLTIYLLVEFGNSAPNLGANESLTSYIPFLFWPGATAFAPLTGIFAIVYGPSALWARIYGCWSRLAIFGIIIMSSEYFAFIGAGTVPTNAGLAILFALISRLSQCYLVDYYVAFIETKRWTRGWDGLSTSLYRSKDIQE